MDFGLAWGQGMTRLLPSWGRCRGACPEPEAVISSFEDGAAMGQAIERRGGHLGIAEGGGPFNESEICDDDDAGAIIELAHRMDEQRPPEELNGR